MLWLNFSRYTHSIDNKCHFRKMHVLVSLYNVIEIKVFLVKQLNIFFFFVANDDELRQLIYLLLVLKFLVKFIVSY